MHKRLFYLFALITLLLSACQAAPVATPIPTATTAAPAALEIVGPAGSKTLTMDDIQKLTASTGQAGIKSSTGKITPPTAVKGVSLLELANQVGKLDAGMGVSVEAKDGYAITFSYDQLTKGDFVAYDPGTGDELKTHDPLTAILAYESNGQPLPVESDGNLRLAIISDKNTQVTDGHWAVKWVTKLTVKTLAKEWSLHLEGALTEDMDRATFESGTAPGCHKATWKDSTAQEWSGIPLWLLVGRVDDEIKHNTGAYNDALADAGYTIEITAADGYKVTLDSKKVKRNDNIIVANMVNGNPLDDQNFPLRLVGSDLTKKEMAGKIVSIKLNLNGAQPAAATSAPTVAPTVASVVTQAPAAAGTAALTINGAVAKEVTLSLDDLKKMTITKETVTHPKKGQMDVQGVLMSDLLALVAPKDGVKTVTFVASDGYKVDVDLSAIKSCPKAMVAIGEDGSLSTVMPDLESNTWVKNLTALEFK
jgi:DMSO/TMAO reductase YedYZ molybdopterin-dependent catalytic subunit